MNIRGSRTLDAPREAVFAAILDPNVLLGVIPGCQEIERVSDTEYRGRISLRLPGMVGSYRTVVRVVDSEEPSYGRLDGEVVGTLGSIRGGASFRLAETDGGTAVDYDGQATIGGPLARLDSRFVEGLAGSLIDQGLGNLEARLLDAPPAGVGADSRGVSKETAGVTVTNYVLPRSLPEALELVDRHGSALLVMAGGTVAMPLINDGISLPRTVMGLRHAGLRGLERSDGVLRIGATTTLTQLAEQDDIPMLREAARRTASWAVRNLATVGGNLFTPPPGGDIAVALLALDTTVTLTSTRGERTVPLADFFTGFMTTRLADDELLISLETPIPLEPTAFIKFGRKDANTPAVVTVATRITRDGDVVTDARVALGAAGPHPIRALAAERALAGTTFGPADIAAAAAAASDACDPFTDAVATDWYRRRMVGVFVGRALEQLAPGAAQERR